MQSLLGLPALAPLVVAVSGGVDSMALAHMLAVQRRPLHPQQELHTVVIDHGLRPESAVEAQWVVAQLQKLPVTSASSVRLDQRTQHSEQNIQAWARNARYSALAGLAAQHGTRHILTAHHADDQLETLFVRLAAKSGWTGLAGMRSCQAQRVAVQPDPIFLHRPLLRFSKSDLLDYCLQNQLQWAEDPSNARLKYARNRVRRGLSQLGLTEAAVTCPPAHSLHTAPSALRAALLDSQVRLAAARHQLESAAVKLLEKIEVWPRLSLCSLSLTSLKPLLHSPAQGAVCEEALRRCLALVTGQPQHIASAQPVTLLQWLQQLSDVPTNAPATFKVGEALVCVVADVIYFTRAPMDRSVAASWSGMNVPEFGGWWDHRIWLRCKDAHGLQGTLRLPTAAEVAAADVAHKPPQLPRKVWRSALSTIPVLQHGTSNEQLWLATAPRAAVESLGLLISWQPAPDTVTVDSCWQPLGDRR